MLQKMRRTNDKGFTLIELMIVIAIIGILAAIAIPNFIAYRNKSFCSAAETDANGIVAAISDYFAVPTRITTPAVADLNNHLGYKFSGPVGSENTGTITGADANVHITIQVTDTSTRCPVDYQSAMQIGANTNAYWDKAGVYTKVIVY